MDLTLPITGASKVLLDRLPEWYLVTPQDKVWSNYVHLLVMYLIEKEPWKSYQFYVRTAIEWITIDQWYVHYDPYELWIDAGYFDSKLNEITDNQ